MKNAYFGLWMNEIERGERK